MLDDVDVSSIGYMHPVVGVRISPTKVHTPVLNFPFQKLLTVAARVLLEELRTTNDIGSEEEIFKALDSLESVLMISATNCPYIGASSQSCEDVRKLNPHHSPLRRRIRKFRNREDKSDVMIIRFSWTPTEIAACPFRFSPWQGTCSILVSSFTLPSEFTGLLGRRGAGADIFFLFIFAYSVVAVHAARFEL
jgi:hypothetical protein